MLTDVNFDIMSDKSFSGPPTYMAIQEPHQTTIDSLLNRKKAEISEKFTRLKQDKQTIHDIEMQTLEDKKNEEFIVFESRVANAINFISTKNKTQTWPWLW